MAVALITGTSSGIGLAAAVHFARQGYEVWAGVRNPDTATDLHEAIARDRLAIRPVTLDVDDPASVERGVAEALAASGAIDVLVNNAGIGGGGPIEEVSLDWAHGLFETNYFGVVRTTQAVLPGMRRRRAGAIVNVSSIAGRLAIAGHGHYSAVKHALEAMSEALAQEVQGFGIRVRWLVGEDAKLLDAGRRRLSDEEYIASARPMPDEQYLEEMRRRYRFEW